MTCRSRTSPTRSRSRSGRRPWTPTVPAWRSSRSTSPRSRSSSRSAGQPDYPDSSVRSFPPATSGVADATQIHTHLCYSAFGEVIDSIARLDADVTSIEAARSHMEILGDLDAAGFTNQVGPGVYDIHSPRVPAEGEIAELLREAV